MRRICISIYPLPQLIFNESTLDQIASILQHLRPLLVIGQTLNVPILRSAPGSAL